ncbi:unnamed protein product [Acanthoscelides obtectus]|uniref:C2H2-type domain-containing protein n=2 Tax=Acanthoscelides obtectus TaxID=200917 RepID=A0A9P0JMY3_ACAOB|nr:unnamed protein product [Acanthoscelides obtectus]CAK1661491.1 Zinc finger protein 569 [Acanthoscelides obtectus]
MELEKKIYVEGGSIMDYCLICLKRNKDLYKLDDYPKCKLFLADHFSLEFNTNAFGQLPLSLCTDCNGKLSNCCEFFDQIRKSLAFWQSYSINSGMKQNEHSDCEDIEDENSDDDDENPEDWDNNKESIKKEELSEEDKKLVQDTISEYKQKFHMKQDCSFCGFVAESRRVLSAHMATSHSDKKNSWCPECNVIYENIIDHRKIHQKNVCPLCYKEFHSNHYLEHLQGHTDKYKCKYCSLSCAAATSLKKHMLVHLKQDPYQCPNCDKTYKHPSSFSYHLKKHGQFTCINCEKHFVTERELITHQCVSNKMASEDSEKKLYSIHNQRIKDEQQLCDRDKEIRDLYNNTFCINCNKRVKNLDKHNANIHNMNGKPEVKKKKVDLKCGYCEKVFLTRHNYRLHIMVHTGETPFKCQYCDKKVASLSRLVTHERTHTGEKPFICSVCGKAFGQNSALNTHMKQHTGRPEVCQICSKTFCRKSELKLHMDKHIGLKPHLCTECGKAFAQKSHLTDHMKGHGEERPFQCQYCDKAFKKKVLLKSHLDIHAGIKRFQCDYCQYSCYKAYRLRQHLKLHLRENIQEQGQGEELSTTTQQYFVDEHANQE